MDRRGSPERRTARTKIIAFILVLSLGLVLISDCGPSVPYNKLPEPILDDNPELVDLYREAWNLIDKGEMKGNRINQFPDKYINPEHTDIIDQWSTTSLALFAVYGFRQYPVMSTLDLFYRKQRSDGFISRAYISNSGDPLHLPTQLDPMVHPPLFAWVELKYFAMSADTMRLNCVFLILEKYFNWIDQFCRGKYEAGDLYYTTLIGSGMMNMPRGDIEAGGWIDISAQMALFADNLRQISEILGNDEKYQYYSRKYSEIRNNIKMKLWQPDSSFYFDMTREGKIVENRNIAGYWPLFAGIPNRSEAAKLVGHLKDSSDFRLVHMFPSVSIRNPEYNPRGFYWRGGVWGITNYMVVQGLIKYGFKDFAREAALNHVQNMAQVYEGFDISITDENPETDLEIVGNIWELYAPDEPSPGTRWDAQNYCKSDCISFSGHGPISMLIENILGFTVDAPHNTLIWEITRSDRHGIRHLAIGQNKVSLWTEPDSLMPELLSIQGRTEADINLKFITQSDTLSVGFDPGKIAVDFVPEKYFLRDRFIRKSQNLPGLD